MNTFLGGDRPQGTLTSPAFEISRKYINFLIGGGSHADQTCINLLVDGKVVRTATGKDNEKLEWHFWNVEDLQGKTARIEIVDRNSGGWGHINIDQIELADESSEGNLGPFDKLPDYGSLVLAFAEEAISAKNTREIVESASGWSKRLHATLGRDLSRHGEAQRGDGHEDGEAGPGATRTFTFVLAWFFPNHPQGHEYDSRFADAAKVAQYVLDNHDRLAGDTKKWHQTFYEDSTLPRWLLFRLHSTVCNLATGTCQWWQQRPVLGVGRRRLLRGDLHARLELRPRARRGCSRNWSAAPARCRTSARASTPNSGLVGFRSNRSLCGGRPVRHDSQGLPRAPVLGGQLLPAAELAADQEGPGILDQAGRQ